MRNKQTIQQVDERLDILYNRLTRTVGEMNDLRLKRKRMVAGKIKVPPPAGKKVKLEVGNPAGLGYDAFGDLIPHFGPR